MADRLGMVCMFVLVAVSLAAARELEVRKVVDNDTVEAGGSLSLRLEITNPNDVPVDVRIVDRSVVGASGIDIQCLEGQAPPGISVLAYGDFTGTGGIQAFEPGEHELMPAEVTYTDPETGAETTVRSNALTVTVTGNSQGQASSVTTLYQCEGQRIQSTSISRSSTSSQAQQQQQQQQQQRDPQDTQDRVDQMQQGMQSDMQEIAREMAVQQQREQAMQQALESSEEFREADRELRQKRYRPAGAEVRPEGDEGIDGRFSQEYRRGDDEARIEGRMEDGSVTDIRSIDQEDLERMYRAVDSDPQVRALEQQAQQQGFQRVTTNVPFPTNGTSRFNRSLSNPQTNETRDITGTVDLNGTVEDVRMEPEDEEEAARQRWRAALLGAVLILLALYLLNRRGRAPEPDTEPEDIDIPELDWRERTAELLAEARRLFDAGREKEAYMMASEAVRYFFRHELGLDRELNCDDVVRELSRRGRTHRPVAKCLELCTLVSFARYGTNAEDFERIMELAEEATVGPRASEPK